MILFDINIMLNEIYEKIQRSLEMGFSMDDLYLSIDIGIVHHLCQLSHEGRFPELTKDENGFCYLFDLRIIFINDTYKYYHLCIKL